MKQARNRAPLALAAAALVGLVACSEVPTQVGHRFLELRTDRNSYELGDTVRVKALNHHSVVRVEGPRGPFDAFALERRAARGRGWILTRCTIGALMLEGDGETGPDCPQTMNLPGNREPQFTVGPEEERRVATIVLSEPYFEPGEEYRFSFDLRYSGRSVGDTIPHGEHPRAHETNVFRVSALPRSASRAPSRGGARSR